MPGKNNFAAREAQKSLASASVIAGVAFVLAALLLFVGLVYLSLY